MGGSARRGTRRSRVIADALGRPHRQRRGEPGGRRASGATRAPPRDAEQRVDVLERAEGLDLVAQLRHAPPDSSSPPGAPRRPRTPPPS